MNNFNNEVFEFGNNNEELEQTTNFNFDSISGLGESNYENEDLFTMDEPNADVLSSVDINNQSNFDLSDSYYNSNFENNEFLYEKTDEKLMDQYREYIDSKLNSYDIDNSVEPISAVNTETEINTNDIFNTEVESNELIENEAFDLEKTQEFKVEEPIFVETQNYEGSELTDKLEETNDNKDFPNLYVPESFETKEILIPEQNKDLSTDENNTSESFISPVLPELYQPEEFKEEETIVSEENADLINEVNEYSENTENEEPNELEEITDSKEKEEEEQEIEMSATPIEDLNKLTEYEPEYIEPTNINDLFDRVSVNVKDASDIFRKNTEMKQKIDSRFDELKKLQSEVENSKQHQIDEVNAYKEEVLFKLTEKKEEIEKRLNTLREVQANLEQEKKDFEEYKKAEKAKIEKVQKEVQSAYDGRREELSHIEDTLRKQKDALDEERNQLSLDRIQYESDKNDLANNLLKFNELVNSFTNEVNRVEGE